MKLRVATCQFPVRAGVRQNLRYVAHQIRTASERVRTSRTSRYYASNVLETFYEKALFVKVDVARPLWG